MEKPRSTGGTLSMLSYFYSPLDLASPFILKVRQNCKNSVKRNCSGTSKYQKNMRRNKILGRENYIT